MPSVRKLSEHSRRGQPALRTPARLPRVRPGVAAPRRASLRAQRVLRRGPIAFILAATVTSSSWLLQAAQRPPAAAAWRFVVSGDARDCGDVVTPAIAETARANRAAFYWHLGDLRNSYTPDMDIQHQPEHVKAPLSLEDYRAMEWRDFIASQIAPFGSIPYFIGIGNHEVVETKTREEYVATFAAWLDTPVLRAQRQKDTPADTRVTSYYHWIDRGIGFYFLDNATDEELDDRQMAWFERALTHDTADRSITTIVAGMHKPLPDGYNTTTSMNESPRSTETGRRVYADLLKARDDAHKRVYVLASHQHFYMEDAYDTPYWKDHGGVLPGWVVGTAGALRSRLPNPSPLVAMTNVYGSLVATVLPDGEIRFVFQQVKEEDTPRAVVKRYGREFVHWCFENNTTVRPRP